MRAIASTLSLFVVALSLNAQQVDTKAVDRIMNSVLQEWRIPGAAVAIVKNDRVVYLNGYGTKQLGGSDRVTADTLFQIASTSKAFTSTALAMLVSDRKLSWDDPVHTHLDYFRLDDLCADSQVTIRDIVSHRTGISRHDELWDNTPLTREQVIRSIGQVPLNKPFRTAYQYQNIMFIAAGEVVAQTAGMPWDDFVKTRIFQPLGMTSTVTLDADWNKSDHATGHRYDWRNGRVSAQRPIDTWTLGPAGSIKSSARDMAAWLRFQLAGGMYDGRRLVEADALQETKTPQTVIRVEASSRDTNPETNVMSYGMGWVVQDYRGELLVSHAGALNGFRTHIDLLPRRNAGFVVLLNAGRGMAAVALRNSLADLLSGKPLRDWNAYYLMVDHNSDEKDERERQVRDASRARDTKPTLPLESYAGTYRNGPYGKATVTPVDGTLVLQWNRLTIPLTHFEYDVFNARDEEADVDEQVTFDLGTKRKVEALTLFGERFVRE